MTECFGDRGLSGVGRSGQVRCGVEAEGGVREA
jgi:hypothetical protein